MTTLKTAAEARAHKRQVEQLNEDAKRLCAVDVHTPFRSLQDAVDRLLPFHIFGALEPDAADREELQGIQHPELIISRSHQVSQQIQLYAMETVRRVDSNRGRVDAAQHRYSLPPGQQEMLLPEDRYIIARAMLQEAREQLERERRKPAGYMTPERTEDDMLELLAAEPEPQGMARASGTALAGGQQQTAAVEAGRAAVEKLFDGMRDAGRTVSGGLLDVQGAGVPLVAGAAGAQEEGTAGAAVLGPAAALDEAGLADLMQQQLAAEVAAGAAAAQEAGASSEEGSEESEEGESGGLEEGEEEGEERDEGEGDELQEGEEMDEGEAGEGEEEGEEGFEGELDPGAEWGSGDGDGDGDVDLRAQTGDEDMQGMVVDGDEYEDVSTPEDDDDDGGAGLTGGTGVEDDTDMQEGGGQELDEDGE